MKDDANVPHHWEHFATTPWTTVLAAGSGIAPDAQESLPSLCQAYWYPLYAYVRRLGYQPNDAQDLTQGFFARILEKNYLRAADPRRGRFRSFLLTAFNRFLSKERDRAHSQRRGGGRKVLPLDFKAGENRYSLEPAHGLTAERIFEQRWAMTLLDGVVARLRAEFSAAGKSEEFDSLKSYLTGLFGVPSYQVIAAQFQMTEGAVKVAVHRLRRRFRHLLRMEIAQTVSSPEEVDEELRHLFVVLRAANPEAVLKRGPS